ncbi:MAG TPA: MFS transporter [Ignavibacteriaceae bacterium]|nr:MFS transporter [Ignavibacteriaceae bacterium]
MKFRSKIPRQVVLLSLVSFFTDIASEMLYPVTPIFLAVSLSASMTIIGIAEGLAEVTASLFKAYFGRLSDRIKKRSLFVILGYTLSSIVKPLPGLIPNISTVLAFRVVDRLGKGIRSAPRDALLASYVSNDSGRIFGFHRGMDTLGAAFGPIAALIILYFYPGEYVLIFLLAIIPSFFSVFLTFFVRDKFIDVKKRGQEKYFEFLFKTPVEYKIFLILYTIFSIANSSDVFLILKLRHDSGSEMTAILGYITYNIVYASFSFPAGIISDKYSKKLVFTTGLLVFTVVYFGFGLVSNPILLFLCFGLYGVYSAFTEGISKAWISDLIPDKDRGSAIGLVNMLSGLGVMFGSFLSGVLWDQFGSTVPFICSASIALFVYLLFMTLRRFR